MPTLAKSSRPTHDSDMQVELASLTKSKWANLGMGLAGIGAAWISHSDALLVDGLFSLIGFAAAIFGARAVVSANKPPNTLRPLGFAADEVIFAMFRSLALLVLVLTSVTNATLNILDYLAGGRPAELVYSAIVIYLVCISAVCFLLARTHRSAWVSTGKRSAILALEAKAALFDGFVTLAAGLGLLVFPLIAKTSIGWISPMGDSLVILMLCTFAIGAYWADFRKHLSQLAISSATDEDTNRIAQLIHSTLHPVPGAVLKIDVLGLGRLHQVLVHFNPAQPVEGTQVDKMTDSLNSGLKDAGYQCQIAILISANTSYSQEFDNA